MVARDYNRPSIIAWVPINENWGVNRILTDRAQQEQVKAMYHLIPRAPRDLMMTDWDKP